MPKAKSEFNGLSLSESQISLVVDAAYSELFAQSAAQFRIPLEDLFLAGFAVLLGRLTRQDCVQVVHGSSQTVQVNIDDRTSMQAIFEAMHPQADERSKGIVQRLPFEAESKRTGADGSIVRYEFLVKEERPILSADCGLRLIVLGSGRALELASPVGKWPTETLDRWLKHSAPERANAVIM